jgi:hypothetical protein
MRRPTDLAATGTPRHFFAAFAIFCSKTDGTEDREEMDKTKKTFKNKLPARRVSE